MQLFNRWCLIFSIETFCLATLLWAGLFSLIVGGDPTFLGLIIPSIWFLFSIWVGLQIWRKQYISDRLSDFFVDALQGLGLLGTVGGFILGLAGLDIAKLLAGGSLLESIGFLFLGTGTALYATLMGIGCSILLRIQLLVNTKV